MSTLLKHKGYEGTAEIAQEGDICFGKILFIDDLVTYQADTPTQLRIEFEAAVDDYLATCKELGRDPKKPFSGQFNVRVSPEQHRTAARRAQIEEISLNAVVSRALDLYLSRASESQPGIRELASVAAGATVVWDVKDVIRKESLNRILGAGKVRPYFVSTSTSTKVEDLESRDHPSNVRFTPHVDVTSRGPRRDH